MNLAELQRRQRDWLDHNFPNVESWEALVGAQEELGELAHAHLKGFNNIRGLNSDDTIGIKKADAVADVIIYLASYCNTNGIDLAEAVRTAWNEVEMRDWQKFPINGIDV